MGEALIEFKNVTKRFGNRTILDQDQSKVMEGNIADLDQKKEQHKQRVSELQELQKNIVALQPTVDSIKAEVNEEKAALQKLEADVSTLLALKKELDITSTSINHKAAQRADVQRQEKQLLLQLELLEKETSGLEPQAWFRGQS